MLSHIYRLIRNFKLEHGIHPNLLHLNRNHVEHLKAAFEDSYSLEQIMNVLDMELIIEEEIMHPHVAWTTVAQLKIAS
jgi:hypothetical protein